MKVLIVHGPNLQLLGKREPGIYGNQSLEAINLRLSEVALELGCEVEFFQSNSEGGIVDRIGSAVDAGFAGIVMNPAAYTHTSYAIYDALRAVGLPTVEVHLSNVHGRESFRSVSLTAPACVGVVAGFGGESYEWALRALQRRLNA